MKILLKSLEVCSFSVLRAEVAPVDLTTLSSLRADRTLKTVEKINAIYFVERPFRHFVRVLTFKTVVKCKFLGWPSDGFVTSRASALKTVVKCKSLGWVSDFFITSCVLDTQTCGNLDISHVAEQPFPHFVRVGRSKLW